MPQPGERRPGRAQRRGREDREDGKAGAPFLVAPLVRGRGPGPRGGHGAEVAALPAPADVPVAGGVEFAGPAEVG